jgi:endonuclease YncB( thermonuclease family)
MTKKETEIDVRLLERLRRWVIGWRSPAVAMAVCLVLVGQSFAPAAAIADEIQGPPEIGWSTPCTIVSVYDGDTITVEVRRRYRVRLIDCWAPELNKKAERAAGLESKAALETRVDLGSISGESKGRLFVPLHERKDGVVYPGDSTTLSRVAGWVWEEGSDESLNHYMVRTGYAQKVKPPDASED